MNFNVKEAKLLLTSIFIAFNPKHWRFVKKTFTINEDEEKVSWLVNEVEALSISISYAFWSCWKSSSGEWKRTLEHDSWVFLKKLTYSCFIAGIFWWRTNQFGWSIHSANGIFRIPLYSTSPSSSSLSETMMLLNGFLKVSFLLLGKFNIDKILISDRVYNSGKLNSRWVSFVSV